MEARRMRLAVGVGLVVAVLAGCRGSSPARPTAVPPEARTATAAARAATATATAGVALLSKPPCLVDTESRDELRQLADVLSEAGTAYLTVSMVFQNLLSDAADAYRALADCYELGGTPVARVSPAAGDTATPVACPADAKAIGQLREAAGMGPQMLMLLAMADAETEFVLQDDVIVRIGQLSDRLDQRASELEIACGLRVPGTPVVAPTPLPASG